ncbi:MAG: class I SAM-dependent methyltransferase [Pyrinomonadaceae bacterium]|nr:class I SAM-dependent methyltransferase [Pyrinomonadaceae bacterium]
MKNNAPSSTANVVARNIAFVAATEETAKLVSEQSAMINALFVKEFSSGGKVFLERLKRRWFQMLFGLYERLAIPGLALHQALRKIHIEKFVRESIAEGFAQIIVLGGGLDTLALRLCKEFPLVNFLEIDHPATHRFKRETIEKHHLGGENLSLISADFTHETFAAILKNHPRYQQQLETVFICEGVLMYLRRDEVKGIFGFIREHNKLRKRFIFTFIEPDERGKPNFGNATFLVNLWLKWKKEPFKWGIGKDELKDFLKENDFSFKSLIIGGTSRGTYQSKSTLDNRPIAKGENICVCENASNN